MLSVDYNAFNARKTSLWTQKHRKWQRKSGESRLNEHRSNTPQWAGLLTSPSQLAQCPSLLRIRSIEVSNKKWKEIDKLSYRCLLHFPQKSHRHIWTQINMDQMSFFHKKCSLSLLLRTELQLNHALWHELFYETYLQKMD